MLRMWPRIAIANHESSLLTANDTGTSMSNVSGFLYIMQMASHPYTPATPTPFNWWAW